ncbi:tetratricopeptide repeat protein [Clostridium homopropionicum DSM 5847]|uniref:Tetratricopeptide repeat protein n=1 Tax=Clostridium homopropionicum DSM 5847 TaxID=1121318 RepID=A0A0L6ZA59_9CLOT|nr:tetratricopeptide repeat protein [Clostridium homopropionicum]KOA19856.1 tetratricopeptide repeat protein [Clostridium homopropionicum DSM 5847]SFF75959.1 Tetratricopeptide repeat-containing protein [Clostridium homopropionicum]
MDKARKLYTKALNKYQDGLIDEAMDICEEAISISIKNTAAINLKGLLYYFKGDLESAKALWKLNYEVNEDGVAKKYIHGLKEDEERFSLYTSAVSLINSLKIKEAIKLLDRCKESDYNCINVSNALVACFINIGQYENAVEYVNKVLELDCKNEIANKNMKSLVKNGISRKEFKKASHNNTKFLLALVSIVLLCTIGVLGRNEIKNRIINNGKNNLEAFTNMNLTKSIPTNTIDVSKDTKEETLKKVTTKTESNITKNNTPEIDKGIKYYYINGKDELLVNRNIEKAIDNFNKAYAYGDDKYLYPDIVYFLGVSYEQKNDIENSYKFYREYMTKYPKGNYEAEILYRLVNIYKDKDLNKAKEYAAVIANEYTDSQYNNSIVKTIINR